MFKRFSLYLHFRREVDKRALRAEAIEWTKSYFKQKGVPHWTHEYQFNFPVYVEAYTRNYLHAYAKNKVASL